MSLISSSGRGVRCGPRRAENTSAAALQLSGCPTRAKSTCGATVLSKLAKPPHPPLRGTFSPAHAGEKDTRSERVESPRPAHAGAKDTRSERGESPRPGRVGEKDARSERVESPRPAHAGVKDTRSERVESPRPAHAGAKHTRSERVESPRPAKRGEGGRRPGEGF